MVWIKILMVATHKTNTEVTEVQHRYRTVEIPVFSNELEALTQAGFQIMHAEVKEK